MNNSREPDSYKPIMGLEHKRFAEALEEASETVFVQLTNDENLTTKDASKVVTVQSITKTLTALGWQDYIINGLGEMLSLYQVTPTHKLARRTPKERSQLETYTSSLRAMCNSANSSFILKTMFSMFGLDEPRKRIYVGIASFLQFLKYLETIIAWMEKYLSWIEHGAKLAAVYTNASIAEGGELNEPGDFYLDLRIRAYAFLKTTNFEPQKAATFFDDINNLFESSTQLVDLGHRLYVSLNPEDFEYVFNALVSKKAKVYQYEDTKFANIHELNEYMRQRVKNSLDEPTGFMYNVVRLLDEGRAFYMDKLASDVMDLVVFMPETEQQKLYVKRFENGSMWRDKE